MNGIALLKIYQIDDINITRYFVIRRQVPSENVQRRKVTWLVFYKTLYELKWKEINDNPLKRLKKWYDGPQKWGFKVREIKTPFYFPNNTKNVQNF